MLQRSSFHCLYCVQSDLAERREVSTEAGTAFAAQHSLLFIEASAANTENVQVERKQASIGMLGFSVENLIFPLIVFVFRCESW